HAPGSAHRDRGAGPHRRAHLEELRRRLRGQGAGRASRGARPDGAWRAHPPGARSLDDLPVRSLRSQAVPRTPDALPPARRPRQGELGRRGPHGRPPGPAAREADPDGPRRGRQGQDVHHAGEDLPHPAAGLLMSRPSPTERSRARRGRAAGIRSRRGVALILVLTTVAILSSIAVEFGYQSRVSLRLAENSRDELRAYYLARSAVNLSRLLLHFQKQVDQLGGQLGPVLSSVLAGQAPRTGTGGVPQAPAAAPASNLGIRLWEILPIDSNAMPALLGGGDLSALGATPADLYGQPAPLEETRRPQIQGPPLHSFGGFEGAFKAKIVDENSRINVRGLDGLGATPLATLTQLRAMMNDPKYDFIFDEDD